MITPTNKTLLSVRAIIVRNGQYLILQRSKNDSWNPSAWEFPGGKVDFGEDLNISLKREIKEETGIDINIAEPLYFWDEEVEVEKYKGKIHVALHFECSAPLNAKVILSEEHDNYKWVTLEELEAFGSNLSAHTEEALERLKSSR